MNKEQGNDYRMLLTVQDHLDTDSVIWSPIPRMGTYKSELDELISRISEKSAVAQASTSVSDRKQSLKLSLAVKLASLSGAVQVLAFELGNTDMASQVKFTKSDIQKTKDQELDAIIRNIVAIAQKYLAELADFGVTEAMLSELLAGLEEFNGLIGKPRSILNAKYVALDTVDALFKESKSLLRNKMDNVMLMFKESNPEFYNGYQRARTIVDN